MITELRNIFGISGSEYDLFLIFIAGWIVVFFVHLITNILTSVINGR